MWMLFLDVALLVLSESTMSNCSSSNEMTDIIEIIDLAPACSRPARSRPAAIKRPRGILTSYRSPPPPVPAVSDSDDDCVEIIDLAPATSSLPARSRPAAYRSPPPPVVALAPQVPAPLPCLICPIREKLLRVLMSMSDPARLSCDDCCRSLLGAPALSVPAQVAPARAAVIARLYFSASATSDTPRHHAPHHQAPVGSVPRPRSSSSAQPSKPHVTQPSKPQPSKPHVTASASGKRPAPSTPPQPRCKWANTETVRKLLAFAEHRTLCDSLLQHTYHIACVP